MVAAHELLSSDRLLALIRTGFEQVSDERAENVSISMPDALMSGLAVFSLKDPSLLAFEARKETDSNLGSIFGIENAPGDTQMRIILDEVNPIEIRPVFTFFCFIRFRHVTVLRAPVHPMGWPSEIPLPTWLGLS